jgi:hypothetical protein
MSGPERIWIQEPPNAGWATVAGVTDPTISPRLMGIYTLPYVPEAALTALKAENERLRGELETARIVQAMAGSFLRSR